MQVEVALGAKRGRQITVRMPQTSMTAVRTLRFENIAVLLAKDSCRISASLMLVSARMTSDAAICQLCDTADHALGLMNERYVLQMPALQEKDFVGITGIRDMPSLSHVRPPASPVTNSAMPAGA